MVLTRGASATLISALEGHFHPVILIEADWPDGVIRLHSGVGDLIWDSETWGGISVLKDGNLLSIAQMDLPEESGGLATPTGSISVAGPLEAVLAERGKAIRNRTFTVWFGAVTERAGVTLVDDPIEIYSGYFDSRTFSMSRNSAASFLHNLQIGLGIGPSARAKATITHSYEDQIAAYPGDTAGRHLQLMEKKLINPPTWPET